MTLQAWAHLGIVAATFLAAYQTHTGWLFVLGSLGLGAVGVAWALARWGMWGVRVAVTAPAAVERGDWIVLPVSMTRTRGGPDSSLQLMAPDRWPHWMRELARDALVPSGWAYVTLVPTRDQPASGTLRIRAERRGEQPLPRLVLQCAWPLGLIAAWWPVTPRGTVLVYPRTPAVGAVPWLRAPGPLGGSRPVASPEAGPWLRGVREHRPGEPVRRIHWPTVARTGQLHVRDTEAEGGESVVLWLDLRPSSHTPETLEHMLEVAAGLIAVAAREGRPLTVESQPGAPPALEAATPEDARSWLARAQATGQEGVVRGREGSVALSPRPLPGWRTWARALVLCPASTPSEPLDATTCCPLGADIAACLARGGEA